MSGLILITFSIYLYSSINSRLAYLEGIYIPQSVLNMAVDDEFGQTKNLPTQVKSVAESGLLSFLSIVIKAHLNIHK